MNSGRTSPLLLAALALGIGLSAFVGWQFLSHPTARPAELASPVSRDDGSGSTPRTLQPALEALAEAPVGEARHGEPSASARSAVDANQLELQVLDAAGVPIPSALLVLFRGEDVLGSANSDAEGLMRFPARAGSAEYALSLPCWNDLRGEVELSAGRRSVSLPAGALVAGRLTLDGGAPGEPVELSWRSGSPARGGSTLPAAVIEARKSAKVAPGVLKLKCDADGGFSFRGLPPDASGTINWKVPYLLKGASSEYQGSRFEVPVPKGDIDLRLVSALRLRLRVVNPAAEPIAGANVSLKRETKTDHGSRSSTSGRNADSEGRVEETFLPESFGKLIVSVAAADGGGAFDYEFRPPAVLRGVWDLGDLATRGTRTIDVLVQDSAGKPIEGARAMPWPAPDQVPRAVSAADGHITIGIAIDDFELAVQAFGYVSARFPAPADATQLTAVLSPACMLEFEVQGLGDGKTDLVMEVRGESPVFCDEQDQGQTPDMLRSSGGSSGSTSGDGTTSFECSSESPGRWRIAGLLPNRALHAALKSGDKILREVDVAPLSAGEQRKIVMSLEQAGKQLRVRVLTQDGQPASTAVVYAFDPGQSSSYHGRGVDENGEIEITGLFGDHCTVFAKTEGLGTASRFLRPIPDGTVELRLEPPHSVEVELVQPNGALFVDSAQVSVHSDVPGARPALSVSPGRYRLDDLPSGELQIEVWGAFGRNALVHDTSVEFVRMVVGESGRFLATLQVRPAQAESRWRMAVALPGAAIDLTREEFRGLSKDKDRSTTMISGLAPGTYDVWLETFADDGSGNWSRVGKPTSATIRAEDPSVMLKLHAPD